MDEEMKTGWIDPPRHTCELPYIELGTGERQKGDRWRCPDERCHQLWVFAGFDSFKGNFVFTPEGEWVAQRKAEEERELAYHRASSWRRFWWFISSGGPTF